MKDDAVANLHENVRMEQCWLFSEQDCSGLSRFHVSPSMQAPRWMGLKAV
jgi:hypothetical protein